MRSPNSIEPVPIGQSHVQQDNVHSTLRKMSLGFAHAQAMRQFETVGLFLTEHLSKQTNISRVVLNQKNLQRLFAHELAWCGSLTTDNQKLSMLFTTVRNPSRPTGLVM